MATPIYQPGAKVLTALNGTETVVVNNGSPTITIAPVSAFANSNETFGNGTATFLGEGLVNVQTSASGVNPGTTGNDNVLAVFSIPANSFSSAGKTLSLAASGAFAATANTKTVKIIFNPFTAVVGSAVGSGGTSICTTGAVTTSGGGWWVGGHVVKYGATGSNTQIGVNDGAVGGATYLGVTAPAAITANESAVILVAITGNAATATTDISFNSLIITASN